MQRYNNATYCCNGNVGNDDELHVIEGGDDEEESACGNSTEAVSVAGNNAGRIQDSSIPRPLLIGSLRCIMWSDGFVTSYVKQSFTRFIMWGSIRSMWEGSNERDIITNIRAVIVGTDQDSSIPANRDRQ